VEKRVGPRVDAGLGRHLDAAAPFLAECRLEQADHCRHAEAGGGDIRT